MTIDSTVAEAVAQIERTHAARERALSASRALTRQCANAIRAVHRGSFAEAEEHLAVIRRALLVLEKSIGQPRHDAANLEELFRSFHSLKGIAGMVEHRETELLAHELESYLRAIREGETVLTAADRRHDAGATRYLTKPFKPAALLAEARSVLDGAVQDAR